MNDLKPDELQNSSWVRSTRSSFACASSAYAWVASTKGFRMTDGFTVEIVPLKVTLIPRGSGIRWAEYFSSDAWGRAVRAAKLAMRDSDGREARSPDGPLGLHGDAFRRHAADADFHLCLEADAREPEPAARRRGVLLHRPEVRAERVRLAVHRLDPAGEDGELLLGAGVRHPHHDVARHRIELEVELDLVPARVRDRVLQQLDDPGTRAGLGWAHFSRLRTTAVMSSAGSGECRSTASNSFTRALAAVGISAPARSAFTRSSPNSSCFASCASRMPSVRKQTSSPGASRNSYCATGGGSTEGAIPTHGPAVSTTSTCPSRRVTKIGWCAPAARNRPSPTWRAAINVM